MKALRVTSTFLSRKALTACRPRLYFGVPCTVVRPVLATTRPANTYSTTTPTQVQAQSLAPKVERGASKLFKDADAAVADIKSGSTILSSGFGLCGVAGLFVYDRTRRTSLLTNFFGRNAHQCYGSSRCRSIEFLDGCFEQCRRGGQGRTLDVVAEWPAESIDSFILGQ